MAPIIAIEDLRIILTWISSIQQLLKIYRTVLLIPEICHGIPKELSRDTLTLATPAQIAVVIGPSNVYPDKSDIGRSDILKQFWVWREKISSDPREEFVRCSQDLGMDLELLERKGTRIRDFGSNAWMLWYLTYTWKNSLLYRIYSLGVKGFAPSDCSMWIFFPFDFFLNCLLVRLWTLLTPM